MKSLYTTLLSVLFAFTTSSIHASPLSCIKIEPIIGEWSAELNVMNRCGQAIDLRDSVVEINSNQALSGNFWGDFAPLSYPERTDFDSVVEGKNFRLRIPLLFSKPDSGYTPNTKLQDKGQIQIQFSANRGLALSDGVFLTQSTPISKTSKIMFHVGNNPGVSQQQVKLSLSNHRSFRRELHLPWATDSQVDNIPYGQYEIEMKGFEVGGRWYEGHANPSQVIVEDAQGARATIDYKPAVARGRVAVVMPEKAPEANLAAPELLIQEGSQSTHLASHLLAWGKTVWLDELRAGQDYRLKLGPLVGKMVNYSASFSPSNLVHVDAHQSQRLKLSFTANPLDFSRVHFSIQGLPTSSKPTIKALDDYQHQFTTSVKGEDWLLPAGRHYQLSAAPIHLNHKTYVARFEPSAFLAKQGNRQTIKIQFTSQEDTQAFSPYVDVSLNNITRWDNESNSMQPTGLLDLVDASGVKSLHLAFITAGPSCQGVWAGYPVSQDAQAFGVPVFKTLHQRNIALTIALGGLNGTYLAQACQTQQELVAAYEQIIEAYQPQGLDFDVENAMQSNNQQLDRMMKAIERIKAKYPALAISFTLPVLPSGLVKGLGENVIQRAAKNRLHDYAVNIMAMDYGPGFQDKSMSAYAIDAATNTFYQLKAAEPDNKDPDDAFWHRIQITPMIGLNDTAPLNFKLSDVDALKAFAKQKGLGMLSYWSMTRDHPCDDKYASAVCSSIDPTTGRANQKNDYEYAKRFLH